MYSNYSGLKVRNNIMKMLAPYPRKISVKTLRVLMNDFEVSEVLFRSKKSKTDFCPFGELSMILPISYFPVSHTKNTGRVSLGSLKIKKLTKRSLVC